MGVGWVWVGGVGGGWGGCCEGVLIGLRGGVGGEKWKEKKRRMSKT